MRRSEVAALLWPELTRALASTNLRKALFRLRDASWAEALEADGDLLRFVVATDVDDFAAQVREGRLSEALTAHRGTLLEGFDDDANEPWSDWLRTQRERWRDAWRAAALQRLAEPVEAEEGLEISAALLRADALYESALQAHLQHLARTGQAPRARETYRAFAKRLQQELGVEPGSALRAVHDGLQGRGQRAAPPQAVDDSYVGRVFEQRRILELMQRPDCRLLAIVGPGGIGKTRLVRRVWEDVAAMFEDGATFVGLEDVDTPGAFVTRVARDLEIASNPKRDELDAVAEHLSGRHALLVLDNFEPVALAATPLLGQLLERAPRLKLIVTTRERLALGAQWALPLDGLPCPEPEDMDRLEDFDASRLFMVAARRADPALDPQAECAAIVDICRQVDGLPLALELAAAWTRVMRCADIARELRQGAELLRATNAAFPARQASVEAVFEQSWRLLGGPERQALARLSVFRGGFTVEGARAVAAAPLPVLGALTDKSLLRKDGARLTLHPLVQQFAALKLGDADQQLAARTAHARFFHGLLVERYGSLHRGDAQALRWFDDELENCRVAFEWLSVQGPAWALTTAAASLSTYCQHRGMAQRGLAMIEAALAGPLALQDLALRPRLQVYVAQQQYRLDRLVEAKATARHALASASVTVSDDDGRRQLQLLNVLGSVALRLGRLDEARAHYEAVLSHAPDEVSTRDRAVTLDHLSLIERRRGRFDEALRLALEALVLQRRIGEPAVLAMGLNNLASLYLARGEPEAAEPMLTEALTLCERGGLTATLCLVLANLCQAALVRSDLDAAVRHGTRGVEAAEAGGQRMLVGWIQADLGQVALRRSDLVAARASIKAACTIACTIAMPALRAKAAMAFAQLLHQDGHVEAARRVLTLVATGPSLGPGERAELDLLCLQWGAPVLDADPGLTLESLLHLATVDAPGDHKALIASLGG